MLEKKDENFKISHVVIDDHISFFGKCNIVFCTCIFLNRNLFLLGLISLKAN